MLTSTTMAIAIAYLALHSTFIWGRLEVFRIDGPPPSGVRLIEWCSTASMLVGATLIASRPGGNAWLDGLTMVLATVSGCLFAWGVATVGRKQLTAAFSVDLPHALITCGPFRYVRNPFYLSYILAHSIPVFASGSPWALPGLCAMTAIYTRAALLEERKFQDSPLARDWRAYRQTTGRFLPRLSGILKG